MGAKINNTELIKNLIDKAKINIQLDKVPNELAEKILPVIIVAKTENLVQVKAAVASDTTSITIHSTSTVKDTFLVAMMISVAKDALATSIYSRISLTPFGTGGGNVLSIRYEPLTAASGLNNLIVLPIPIKLKRGTTITVINSTATASIDTAGIVYFYEVED